MALEHVEVDFDTGNPHWIRSYGGNRMLLQARRSWANQTLAARGYLPLNEVLETLALPQTEEGAVMGWINDGVTEVDFGEEADIPPPGKSIRLSFNVNSTNVFRDKK